MNPFLIGASSLVGQRTNNEDAFFVASRTPMEGVEKLGSEAPHDVVALVADGMGGGAHGEKASAEAAEFLRTLYVQNGYRKWCQEVGLSGIDTCTILREILSTLNQRILALAAAHGASKMGTTADILVIDGDKYYYGHVGDSRIYHLRAAGDALLVTSDHNLGARAKAKGIPESMVRSNIVTSILGVGNALQIDVGAGDLAEGDAFVLCSDGVADVTTATFRRFVQRHGNNVDHTAEAIAAEGVACGGAHADNATVVYLSNAPTAHKGQGALPTATPILPPAPLPNDTPGQPRRRRSWVPWALATCLGFAAVLCVVLAFVLGRYFGSSDRKQAAVQQNPNTQPTAVPSQVGTAGQLPPGSPVRNEQPGPDDDDPPPPTAKAEDKPAAKAKDKPAATAKAKPAATAKDKPAATAKAKPAATTDQPAGADATVATYREKFQKLLTARNFDGATAMLIQIQMEDPKLADELQKQLDKRRRRVSRIPRDLGKMEQQAQAATEALEQKDDAAARAGLEALAVLLKPYGTDDGALLPPLDAGEQGRLDKVREQYGQLATQLTDVGGQSGEPATKSGVRTKPERQAQKPEQKAETTEALAPKTGAEAVPSEAKGKDTDGAAAQVAARATPPPPTSVVPFESVRNLKETLARYFRYPNGGEFIADPIEVADLGMNATWHGVWRRFMADDEEGYDRHMPAADYGPWLTEFADVNAAALGLPEGPEKRKAWRCFYLWPDVGGKLSDCSGADAIPTGFVAKGLLICVPMHYRWLTEPEQREDIENAVELVWKEWFRTAKTDRKSSFVAAVMHIRVRYGPYICGTEIEKKLSRISPTMSEQMSPATPKKEGAVR